MAYTPIQPLPVRERSLLRGAAEGLSYIRQANEIKRQENQKRQSEIIGLLGDVDFPTALNMVNKQKQMKLYNAAEESLKKILSKSALSNGEVTMDDRLQAERVIKVLENELMGIKGGEEMHEKDKKEFLSKPGVYDPNMFLDSQRHYAETGEYKQGLEYAEVPFSVMQNNARKLFKDRLTTVSDIVGNKEITTETSNISDEEKAQYYETFIKSTPGFLKNQRNEFLSLAKENSDQYTMYMQQNNGNLEQAAMDWGIQTKSKDLIPPRVVKEEEFKPTKTPDKDKPIKVLQRQDGSYRWIIGGQGQTYSGEIIPIRGQKKSVTNAKVSDVIIDPNTPENSIITLTVYEDTPISRELPSALSGAKEETKALYMSMQSDKSKRKAVTYQVPYDQLSSFINNNWNLEGIKNIKRTTRKKIDW